MPMIARVLILLLTIGLLARILKGNIAPAFLISAILAGPLLGMDIVTTMGLMTDALRSDQTIRLVVFVLSIIYLSGLLKSTGHLDRIGRAVKSSLGSAEGGVIALPALIGLLPMPGGALFSAPLVDAAAGGTSIDTSRRAASNYWFRHNWEFWWPLYPGIIAALELSGIPWSEWALHLVALTPLATIIGWFFILRTTPRTDSGEERNDGENIGVILRVLFPILCIPVVVLLSSVISAIVPSWQPPSYYVLLAGIGVSIISVTMEHRPSFATWRDALQARRMVSMAFLLICLMMYKGVIAESYLAPGLARELSRFPVSMLFLTSVITFIGGLVTGIAIGFVGATFPIVVALLNGGEQYTIMMGIAYVWGFMGMMASPMHLCLIVTREHFNASWMGMYRRLLPTVVVTGILSTAILLGQGYLLRAFRPDVSSGPPVDIVGSIRRGSHDELFHITWPGRGKDILFEGRSTNIRWPLLHPSEPLLAFFEKNDPWDICVADLNNKSVAVIETGVLAQDPHFAWSTGDDPTLAVSAPRPGTDNTIYVWSTRESTARMINESTGARCPFWTADSLAWFSRGDDCWEIMISRPPEWSTEILCTGLPDLEPHVISIDTSMTRLAYIAMDPESQPPRGRLLTLDMKKWEIQEVEIEGADLRSPAWSRGGDLHFLCNLKPDQYLMRVSMGDSFAAVVCSLSTRMRGSVILPEREVIIGIGPRFDHGTPFDLIISGWDGIPLRRFRDPGKSYWGISATS